VHVVEAFDIFKRFRQGDSFVCPIAGISLHADDGEIVEVMGPSGSGKTTLLCILAGLLRPDRGRVVLCGQALLDLDEKQLGRLRLRCIGFVFQRGNMIEDLTAVENVMLVRRLLGDDRRAAARHAAPLLGALMLDSLADALPRQLSAGERQRLALARALVNRPAVIIADEPTAHLASAERDHVALLLREAVKRQNASAIIATHDLALTSIADRVVRLEAGQLLNGPPKGEGRP
jgi:putative ABC transport system ATP-binding protein